MKYKNIKDKIRHHSSRMDVKCVLLYVIREYAQQNGDTKLLNDLLPLLDQITPIGLQKGTFTKYDNCDDNESNLSCILSFIQQAKNKDRE